MNFGQNLKQLLDEHEISQADLAKSIGYSQRAISKWVNKQAEPSATAVCLIAKFFGITADEILGRVELGNVVVHSGITFNISTEEQQLVLDYRSLTPPLQRMILETMQTFKQSEINSNTKRGNKA